MGNIVVRDDIVFRDELEENNSKVVKKLDEVEGVVLNGGEQVIAALEELNKTGSNLKWRVEEANYDIESVKNLCKVIEQHLESCAVGLNNLINGVKMLEGSIWVIGSLLLVMELFNIIL